MVNIRGIDFWSIGTYHDDKGGKLLGESSMLCFEVDGVKVGHSGDLGHPLTQEQLDEIKRYGMDVLLLCIGLIEKEGERFEKYVIDTETKIMNEVYEALRSTIKFLIPIHFRNEKCDFRFVTVDEFCRGKPNVALVSKAEAEFSRGMFPTTLQILVLEPAL